MTQPRKEQINILRAYWSVFTYTATGGTTSTTIVAATLQASTVTQIPGGNASTTPPIRGIITSGSGGFVRLRKSDTALSLDDTGAQIFGRLTFAAGSYTITYKKISGGVEVSATLPEVGGYSVEMLLPEVMNFGEVPADADIIYGSFQELLTNSNGISGDLTVSGNTTLGDAITDTITLNARFISDLIPTPDNTRSLGTSALRWADGNFTQISLRADNTNTVKSVYDASGITATGTAYDIDGNSSINIGTSTGTGTTIGRVGVTTTVIGLLNPTGNITVGGDAAITGNTTITGFLTVNDSPSTFNGDVDITGTLTVGSISFANLIVNGNTTLGDDPTVDTVEFLSGIFSDFNPKFSDTYDLGATNLRWRTLHSTRVEVHGDDTNAILALLDSDSLLSTATSFDIDGYGTLFFGVTHASEIQIGQTSTNTVINANEIEVNTTLIRGLNTTGLEITGAFAPNETDGSDITIRGPTGGSSTGAAPGGAGGRAFLTGGFGGSASGSQPGGNGGEVDIRGGSGVDGNATYSPTQGGSAGIIGGNAGQFFGFGQAKGGNVNIFAGDGYRDADSGGGTVFIQGGSSTVDNSNGGDVTIRGGSSFFGVGGNGGNISIVSGDGASDRPAGTVTIGTGTSGASAGNVFIFSDGPINIQGAGGVSISGALFLYGNTTWQGGAYPSLPNGGGVSFAIESTQVGPTVLAPALDTLTNNSDATGLHYHLGTGSYLTTGVQTSTYSATYGDLVQCDPSGGGFTVNLPTALAPNYNKSIIIKNITNSTNTIAITPFGFELIDDISPYNISIAYQSITLISNGVGWMVI